MPLNTSKLHFNEQGSESICVSTETGTLSKVPFEKYNDGLIVSKCFSHIETEHN